MKHQFTKHYSLAEARELLPMVRVWLDRMLVIQEELLDVEPELVDMMGKGCDVGGPNLNSCVRMRLDFTDLIEEFQAGEIQIKDLAKGLIDFPAIIEGREVFLCWHKGEEDIEFWHDIEAGFGGRQKISPDYF